MGNSYFQFKQFRVAQDRCAMKVTTDACIAGAWMPVPTHAAQILDIGAGTGLLSLMLAQRLPEAHIVAIELDELAAQQARENFQKSPWSERLELVEGDARHTPFTGKFDFVVVNPPFFNNSLLSGNKVKDQSRHTLTLTQTDLMDIFERAVEPSGHCAVLLPLPESETFEAMAIHTGWHVQSQLWVKHRPRTKPNRIVTVLGRTRPEQKTKVELEIKEEAGHDSPLFKELLSPFYLAF